MAKSGNYYSTMLKIDITEAKARLSTVLGRVERGETAMYVMGFAF